MTAEILVIGGIASFFTVFFGIMGGLYMMNPREPAKAIFCWIVAAAMAVIAATMFIDATRLSVDRKQASSEESGSGQMNVGQNISLVKNGGGT